MTALKPKDDMAEPEQQQAPVEQDRPARARSAGWARIWPFGAYIGFIVVNDVLGRCGVDAAALRWLYAIKIGVVVALLVAFWPHYRELQRTPLSWRAAVAAVLTGVVVLLLWINLNAGWMTIGSSAGFDPRTGGQLDWALVAIRLAGGALVVPVMEELFWRSYLLRWIDSPIFENFDPAQISWRSFVVTVILFGFEHSLWLAGIVAGAAYTVLYMRYRTLWAPILAHAVTNGLLGLWIIATGHWTYW